MKQARGLSVSRAGNLCCGAIGVFLGFMLATLLASRAPAPATDHGAAVSLAPAPSGADDPSWPPRVVADNDNPIFAFYNSYKKGPVIHKWSQYFDVYQHHFARYRGKEVHFLEIGVQSGGSIELWRNYFGPGLRYYGVEVNPYAKPLFEGPNTKIFTGSQDDREFWRKALAEVPQLDIVLDDGGHTMKQQITTFEELYDRVKEGGTYMVEDTGTSYSSFGGESDGKYGGGLKKPGTFMEMAKDKIDDLHGWYHKPTSFTTSTAAISFYDQIVVFEKRAHPKPEFPSLVGSVGMEIMPPRLPDGSMDPAVLSELKRRYANP